MLQAHKFRRFFFNIFYYKLTDWIYGFTESVDKIKTTKINCHKITFARNRVWFCWKQSHYYCYLFQINMKPTIAADEMFPEGVGPYMDLEEVLNVTFSSRNESYKKTLWLWFNFMRKCANLSSPLWTILFTDQNGSFLTLWYPCYNLILYILGIKTSDLCS